MATILTSGWDRTGVGAARAPSLGSRPGSSAVSERPRTLLYCRLFCRLAKAPKRAARVRPQAPSTRCPSRRRVAGRDSACV
jgi:hypothetical protein